MKQYGAFMSPSDERGYERGDAAGFEMERLSYRLDSQEHLLNELRTRRRDSRLLAMREQLNKSQTDLASTSAQYAQLAGSIPRDVSDLSGQLSVIFKSAMAEADQIKAEAHAFAESVRGDAERNALELIREAQLEFEAAATGSPSSNPWPPAKRPDPAPVATSRSAFQHKGRRSITPRTVGEGGLEPPRPEGHWHLKPARLPFRHSPGRLTTGLYHLGEPAPQSP